MKEVTITLTGVQARVLKRSLNCMLSFYSWFSAFQDELENGKLFCTLRDSDYDVLQSIKF